MKSDQIALLAEKHLESLITAAERRETSMGDACSLMAAQAALRDTVQSSKDFLKSLRAVRNLCKQEKFNSGSVL